MFIGKIQQNWQSFLRPSLFWKLLLWMICFHMFAHRYLKQEVSVHAWSDIFLHQLLCIQGFCFKMRLISSPVTFWTHNYVSNFKIFFLIDINKHKDKLPDPYSNITPRCKISSPPIVRNPYRQCTDTRRNKISEHGQIAIFVYLVSFVHNITSKFQARLHHSRFICSKDLAELTTNSQVLSFLKVLRM